MNNKAPESDRTSPLKSFLENNRIYFDILTAGLLSSMAIIISIIQTLSGCQQTRLTRIQTNLANIQWEAEARNATIQRSSDWQRLRDGIWKIFDHYQNPTLPELENQSMEAKLAWFHQMRDLLNEVADNPVLLQDRTSLGCWRNAISTAKFSTTLISQAPNSVFTNMATIKASSIIKDVSYVWTKLILKSDEVSPVGGRPPEAEKEGQQGL